MTESSAPNLSHARIHCLLATVGSAPPAAEELPETTPYDWRDPHYFNEDHRNRLAALMSQAAALLSERFVHFYKSEFSVNPISINQHFAEALPHQIDPDRGFSLPFGPDPDHPRGFLAVAAQTAQDWVTALLGDSEASNDPDRTLSSLEESLLSDLLVALVEAFLCSLSGSENWRPGNDIFKGSPAMPYESTEAICRIVFQVQKADETPAEISFVLSGSALAPIVGKPLPPVNPTPQEQLAPLLMEHLQEMPVTVTARLAATRLRFEEILDLGRDDILLIDKPIAEPIDIIIDNQTVFRGRPAQSGGQYAVLVTERTAAGTNEAAATTVAP